MKKKKFTPSHVKVLDSPPMLIICVVLVVALYIGCFTGLISNKTMRYLVQIFLYITMGEMWNLLSGYAGMTSLGQQLYIGLAGYSIAMATSPKFGLPLFGALLLGAGICVVVSLFMSLILFRLEGMYFSIATLVAAEAFSMWFFSWDFVGKGAGLTIRVSPYPKIQEICVLALTICVVALVLVYCLLRTRVGLGLTAMRDDITAASSVGVNIFSHKLLVYVIAAFFIALSGGIFFVNKGTIYPDSGFDISWTISMVFIAIIGGTGTMSGPIIGAIIYVFLNEKLADFPGWSNIILGAITILVILFLPNGIMGTLQKKLHFEIFSSKRFSFKLKKPSKASEKPSA
ncbi:branched-chain amino acid ABC transporter permease [Ruminococcus difficilis]|uniref:Branched-chain amino acid ABC transporter permease n=1 Tax=Ruminococcus difficilis TaxID=2763069 RepID=A0A934U053_9FIRM|nr:branched-chain amino acid ABC transporter permease [Ruminococcus difficilis]MBK6088075.1 branched-chain amino acid ABC transporter permease [Ruminococcus difficilis]